MWGQWQKGVGVFIIAPWPAAWAGMEMWGLADAKKDVSSQNYLSGYTSESGVSGGVLDQLQGW